jgi:hypothetical protein
MTVHRVHVAGSGIARRKVDLSAIAIGKERRWNKDRRSPEVNEDQLYDPDWEEVDGELDEYSKIALDD